MTVRQLRPDQTVARRPFTSVKLYDSDRCLLTYMLQDVRGLIYQQQAGAFTLEPHTPIAWKVHGLKRRVIVCNSDHLESRRTVSLVGFFGERRPDAEMGPLDRANSRIVSEFRNYPGILSYSSMELADGNWANLVLHDKPGVAARWRGSEAHARAAEQLSPIHYQSVRIHNGALTGGLFGGQRLELHRTKYWDYANDRVWHAVRELTTAV